MTGDRVLNEQNTEEDLSLVSMGDAIDLFFFIINAQIIFFMQAGFAMLEVSAR